MWAAAGEADIRTVVDTARLRPDANTFKTILQTVSARTSVQKQGLGNCGICEGCSRRIREAESESSFSVIPIDQTTKKSAEVIFSFLDSVANSMAAPPRLPSAS
jgi:hypothetical protein